MSSDPKLEALLNKAFARAGAAEANLAITEQRARKGLHGQDALSWEAVLPSTGPWAALATKVLPKLVYFLDCRGAKLPSVKGVFVSLFYGDALYFLEVEDVIAALVEDTGMAPAEMVRRWGAASVP